MIPNDPMILLSYVNLKLRDQFSSLDDMCDDLDLDKEDIIRKLKEAGFTYDRDNNCFK